MRIMTVALTFWVGLAGLALAQDRAPTLTVTGQGQISVVPDMAVISMGVVHVADTARDAMAQVSTDAQALLDVLADAGVEDRDVQTAQLRVNPVRSNGASTPRGITGFEAQTRVSARLRDLERVGTVLDRVLEAGGNTFGGLQFEVQDPATAEAEARAAAVRDAMEKAAQLSAAAGLTLGPILLIKEGGISGGPRPEMFAAARSADVPIAAGEISVQATVTMTFSLSP